MCSASPQIRSRTVSSANPKYDPNTPTKHIILYLTNCFPQDGNPYHRVEITEPHIQALHMADMKRGETVKGYMHFPDLDLDSPCRNSSRAHLHSTLPNDLLSDPDTWRPYVIGLAPWDPSCNTEFLNGALNDGGSIEGFVFYSPDNLSTLPSDPNHWDGINFKNYHFPIFAIPGSDGASLMRTYLEYAEDDEEEHPQHGEAFGRAGFEAGV